MSHTVASQGGGVIIPGVLLHLNGYGVIINGPSGIGKSDCALALLERGHTLIADDAIQLEGSGNRLHGACPANGFGLLHLRDLGIVDITAIYGSTAVQRSNQIDLQITLSRAPGHTCPDSILNGHHGWVEHCHVTIPEITLTAVSQRPLATLVEAAVAQFHTLLGTPSPRQRTEPADRQTGTIIQQSHFAHEQEGVMWPQSG